MARSSCVRTALTVVSVLGAVLAANVPAMGQRTPRANSGRTANPAVTRVSAVTGTITALSSSDGTLAITPGGQASGSSVNLTVTPSTVVSLDGVTSQGLTNLAIGMKATALYQTASGVNTALQVRASSKVQMVGTITAVSADGSTVTIATSGSTDNSTVTVGVAGSASVCLNGNKGNGASSLLPGMQVKIDCQLGSSGNSATKIQASDVGRVHGTISSVALATGSTTAGVVTITPANGSPVSVNVDLNNGTKVIINSAAVTSLTSLSTGMRAEAKYQVTSSGNNATLLRARSGS